MKILTPGYFNIFDTYSNQFHHKKPIDKAYYVFKKIKKELKEQRVLAKGKSESIQHESGQDHVQSKQPFVAYGVANSYDLYPCAVLVKFNSEDITKQCMLGSKDIALEYGYDRKWIR